MVSDGTTTVRIGLLGRGIGSSLSPVMHETEGRRHGLAYRYDLIDFDRLGLLDEDLEAVLDGARARNYWGLNVTYPFKQAIVPILDDLAPEADAIGAVNTVVLREGACMGHNTDCWGFAQSMRTGLGAVQLDHVVQVGAGGAGAAIAHALVQLGTMSIDIVDADLGRAEALAAQVARTTSARTQALTPDQLSEVIGLAAGVVNATPVGMEKHPGLPFDPALLRRRQWVADLVYFPRETELLRRAAAIGCRTLPGGGMAIYQAVRAFRLFTGIEPDSTAMGKTFAAYA
ncbi:shikimate dehydrogenase [Devosia sp. XJ19-1]|uniref:Shikimate dehydrogenase (NADP(+)) n=1 Tax=Devosia ureilytica TaxID=2952754 RepID=A0A9Q4FT45_9HYPH|nr:shikimate dehydrogenase [Devosia ureilytica]MCP8887738.1 shikimate dehydrogenase [Devosia ureilytica]